MKSILIIGCGDIAMRVAPLLRQQYRLLGLIRSKSKLENLHRNNITPIFGNLDHRSDLNRIGGIADVIFHFAPPTNSGSVDLRTRNLLMALSCHRLPTRLIYISTSGVYGNHHGAQVSESSNLYAESLRSLRRLDAESQIRQWATRNAINANILRVPGIYSFDRLPIERLRAESPAIVDEEDSYCNHIHADDLARIVVSTLRFGKTNRAYNTNDDSELKLGEYFDLVADKLNLPRPPRFSRDIVKQTVSSAQWSFMQDSRRLTNARIKKEMRLRLKFPTLVDALKTIS